jgi:casein kinase 1 alpha
MQFEEKPDYNYLRQLFKNIMAKHNFEHDQEFDWILKK